MATTALTEAIEASIKAGIPVQTITLNLDPENPSIDLVTKAGMDTAFEEELQLQGMVETTTTVGLELEAELDVEVEQTVIEPINQANVITPDAVKGQASNDGINPELIAQQAALERMYQQELPQTQIQPQPELGAEQVQPMQQQPTLAVNGQPSIIESMEIDPNSITPETIIYLNAMAENGMIDPQQKGILDQVIDAVYQMRPELAEQVQQQQEAMQQQAQLQRSAQINGGFGREGDGWISMVAETGESDIVR